MTQTNYKRQDFNFATYSKLSIAEQADMFSQLLNTCCQLEKENKAERLARVRLEEKFAQAENSAQLARENAAEKDSQLSLVNAWMSNPNMQPYAKAVLFGTYRAILEAKAHGADERDGRVHIWQKRAAHLCAVSVSTVSDYWDVLKDSDALDIEYVETRIAHGEIQRLAYVALKPPAIFNGDAFEVSKTKKKGAGGKRIPRCPHCKSLDIQKETKYTCRNCSVTGMTKKQLLMDTEEFIAIEAEMNAKLQQDLQAIAESQAQQPTQQAPEEPVAVLQAPTCEKPTRPCVKCGDNAWVYDSLTGKWAANESDTWVWDGKAGKWVCGECEGQVQA